MTNDTTEPTADSGAGTDIEDRARELLTGLWAGQALHAAVKLGVIDRLGFDATSADEVSAELDLDAEYTYRLLRALGSQGVLDEHENRQFSLTPLGSLFKGDQAMSLRHNLLLAHSSTMLSAWEHLPDIVRDGGPDGFVREFDASIFEYVDRNPEFGEIFNTSMSGSSEIQTAWVLDALSSYDFSRFSGVCDIGGGHGHLLCSLLAAHPNLEGTVLERPSVIAEEDRLWAPKLGVDDRCTYTEGDMFDEVPQADAYLLKMILHDWTDDECMDILSNLHDAVTSDGRVFVVERIVPGPETPHFSKLYDVNMMVSTSGRERTQEEYETLLGRAGWDCIETWEPSEGTMSVLEARKT